MKLSKAKKKVQKKPIVKKNALLNKKLVPKKKAAVAKKKPVSKKATKRITKPLASKTKKKALKPLVTVKVLPEFNKTAKQLETVLQKQSKTLDKQVQVLQIRIKKAHDQQEKAVTRCRELEQKMSDATAANGKPVNQKPLQLLQKAVLAAEKISAGVEADLSKARAALVSVEQELSDLEHVKNAISHRNTDHWDTGREEELI